MNINSKHCKECDYLNLCGGRCGRMHQDFDQLRINDFCEMSKYLFDLILDSIDEIKCLMEQNPAIFSAMSDDNIDFTEQIP